MKEQLRKGFRVGAYFIEPLTGVIEGPDGGQRVQPKVVDVLMCLAESQGQLVERDELHRKIWGTTVVSDDAVTRCISELRRAFNDIRGDPKYIQTLPKRGYRLLQPISTGENKAGQRDEDRAAPQNVFIPAEPHSGTRWKAEETFHTPQMLAKQPSESRLFSIDLSPRLADSGPIVSVDDVRQRIVDQQIGRKSATTDLQLGVPAIDQQVIRLRISGGRNENLYEITFMVTTSNGDTVEAEGLLLIFDI